MSRPDVGYVDLTEIAQARMASTRTLFNYWRDSWRDGAPPRRTDIDPVALKSILPYLFLGDIEPDPFRVYFRLIGTAVVDFSRQDFTGKYLDELGYDKRDSIDWDGCYRYVHRQHTSVIGINEPRLTDGNRTSFEFAILPLSRGADPAGSFVAIAAYDQFDHLLIPDLQPVTARD